MKKNHVAGLMWSFIVSAVVCLFLANIAFSEEGPNVLPDTPLYQAKRQMETAELAAGFDPLEKATLHTRYAKERLAEVKAMISKGKLEFVEGLMRNYEKSVTEAMENIERAANQGRDVSEALKAVERSTKKHTEVLTGLLGKVPEQAKSAIAHAIEVSKRGRNRALDVLNKIQRGELPIGRPEGVGIPKGIGKPEGVDRPQSSGRSGGIERSEKRGKPEDIGRPGGAGRPSGGGGRPGGRGR